MKYIAVNTPSPPLPPTTTRVRRANVSLLRRSQRAKHMSTNEQTVLLHNVEKQAPSYRRHEGRQEQSTRKK